MLAFLCSFSLAPVVQWIGHILAEDTMWVRFLPGAPLPKTLSLSWAFWLHV